MRSINQILLSSEVLETKVPLSSSVSALTEDSRKVELGVVYYAVRGTKVDGRQFVEDALDKGAAAIVVDDQVVYQKFPKTVLVDSSRKQFAAAAARWLGNPSHSFDLVGVTGTNGKTTTTFILSHLLKTLGFKTGLVGTIQCEIGDEVRPSQLTTPGPTELQTLFREMAEKNVQKAVMEVTSIALDQYRVWGSRFCAGLFTNLTQDHLDYHGDFESYYAAKKRLFCDYDLPVAVVNIDDTWGKKLRHETTAKRVLTFSLEKAADFSVVEARYLKDRTEAKLNTPEGEFLLVTPFVGEYNLSNCVGALSVAHGLGISVKEAVLALREAKGVRGRLERITPSKSNVFVDFAHTPDALSKVLQELVKLKTGKTGKLITVFGCGGDRDRTKRPIMGKIAEDHSDVVVVTSDNPRTENPDAIVTEIETGMKGNQIREVNRKAAIEKALSMAGSEDIVLIAGKGHETYQIIGTTSYPFDDAQVVRGFYKLCIRKCD